MVTALVVSFSAVTARADCTEDGSGCPGLGLVIAGIGVEEGSVFVGGLITMIGGAVDVGGHRNTRGWRIANYVFASLNLTSGIVWSGFGALGGIFAAPHFALGGADLTVAIISDKRSHEQIHVQLRPLAGRDSTGRPLAGLGIQLAGF